MHRFAVLCDTHGLLRPEAEKALDGCEGIFHAGDVGRPEILERLGRHMPVIAVRGNVDTEGFEDLSTKYEGTFAGLRVFMTHRPSDLPADLTGYDLVICGHTHRYRLEQNGARTLLNPGSCGPRRFRLPVTMAVVETDGGSIHVERISLLEESGAPVQTDMRALVETVMRDTQKGRSPEWIARHVHADPALIEQIARLYLSHPGVTSDGILTKMGL